MGSQGRLSGGTQLGAKTASGVAGTPSGAGVNLGAVAPQHAMLSAGLQQNPAVQGLVGSIAGGTGSPQLGVANPNVLVQGVPALAQGSQAGMTQAASFQAVQQNQPAVSAQQAQRMQQAPLAQTVQPANQVGQQVQQQAQQVRQQIQQQAQQVQQQIQQQAQQAQQQAQQAQQQIQQQAQQAQQQIQQQAQQAQQPVQQQAQTGQAQGQATLAPAQLGLPQTQAGLVGQRQSQSQAQPAVAPSPAQGQPTLAPIQASQATMTTPIQASQAVSAQGFTGQLNNVGQAQMGVVRPATLPGGTIAAGQLSATPYAEGGVIDPEAGTGADGKLKAVLAVTKMSMDAAQQDVGSVVSDVGLSGLLCGEMGKKPKSRGKGATHALIDWQFLNDFSDRLAFRGTHANFSEKVMREFEMAQSIFHAVGSVIGGAKTSLLQLNKSLMPPPNARMLDQAQDVLDQIGEAIHTLTEKGDDSGFVEQLRLYAARIQSVLNPELPLDSGNIYDAFEQVKNQAVEWASSQPSAAKLANAIKTALEDQRAWGNVGRLQKELNAAWNKALPAMENAAERFMAEADGKRFVDPATIAAFLSEEGKKAEHSVYRQVMGDFVHAADQLEDSISKSLEKAGIENEIQPLPMNALKEALGESTVGSRFADIWYDQLISSADPGQVPSLPSLRLEDAYLGKEVFTPIFGAIIQPLMEKGVNAEAARQSLAYLKAAKKGEAKLSKGAAGVFDPELQSLPSRFSPDEEEIQKLDRCLKEVVQNPAAPLAAITSLKQYLPSLAATLTQTLMKAVTYLNSQRPQNPKKTPLDTEMPISKEQESTFHRVLAMAEQPLMAFEYIESGTLLPQDIKTVQTLYPTFYNKMKQALLAALSKVLSEGGSVPYSVRQSASLFLGQPLDSTLDPASVKAVQAVFAKNTA